VLNNESAAQVGGAGTQTAQFLTSRGVTAVITGNCGPNAVQTLGAAGIELFGGQAGTVSQVVERFKTGNLNPTSEATVDSHFGMNVAAGSGRGGGMGGCKGMGRGMGGGRGAGRGTRMSGFAGPRRMETSPQSKDQELKTLKQLADSLNEAPRRKRTGYQNGLKSNLILGGHVVSPQTPLPRAYPTASGWGIQKIIIKR